MPGLASHSKVGDETEELRFFPEENMPELTLPYPPELFRQRPSSPALLQQQ
ncbi:MAG: hypothetical protein J4G05_02860 [Chlorobi bacterium]|nr:hypothetical protein [Chlorobiota bacterium]